MIFSTNTKGAANNCGSEFTNGRGSWTRTNACGIQNPVPYQLGDTPMSLAATWEIIEENQKLVKAFLAKSSHILTDRSAWTLEIQIQEVFTQPPSLIRRHINGHTKFNRVVRTQWIRRSDIRLHGHLPPSMCQRVDLLRMTGQICRRPMYFKRASQFL